MFLVHSASARKPSYDCFSPMAIESDPLVQRLSPSDQGGYYSMRKYFKLADDRNKRNMGNATFQKHLEIVRRYVVRGDGADVDRGIAVGIQFGNNYILVNTQRLKSFMNRSKSCLNGCFHKLGFVVTRASNESFDLYGQIVHRIGKAAIQPRQWCVRTLETPTAENDSSSPFSSPVYSEMEDPGLMYVTDLSSFCNRN